MTQIRIQHTSMQFSDNVVQHRADAKRVFDRAVKEQIWACSGTESGAAKKNHDLRDALIAQAKAHDFFIFAHAQGEWVALNRRFMKSFDRGFAGPYIEAHGGKASEGSHAARGIAWASGMGKESNTGSLCFGSVHFLTNKSESVSGSNQPLINGIGKWGVQHGAGRQVVFLSGDANENDRANDIFNGKPFTTIADELKDWQGTHGPHSYIDFIASYDRDKRVKGKSFDVYDDKEYHLNTDHFLLEAVYEVRDLAAKKA